MPILPGVAAVGAGRNPLEGHSRFPLPGAFAAVAHRDDTVQVIISLDFPVDRQIDKGGIRRGDSPGDGVVLSTSRSVAYK